MRVSLRKAVALAAATFALMGGVGAAQAAQSHTLHLNLTTATPTVPADDDYSLPGRHHYYPDGRPNGDDYN
ncbi:hypothetical protein [Streptomyces sp. NPDC024089]|uniref:hypothetical protein n=1 Tax=Streptomyces sp. NPDC024089 TaxID=3154328 RepID=UPI003411DCA1